MLNFGINWVKEIVICLGKLIVCLGVKGYLVNIFIEELMLIIVGVWMNIVW